VKDNRLGGGNLQTDAAQIFLLFPIPAKAKKSLVFFQSINFLCFTESKNPHKVTLTNQSDFRNY
jgi:hypothetical protein